MESNDKTFNRRQFIQSSTAAAIGVALFGPLAAEARISTPQMKLERWLLQTGREKLDPALYRSVEKQLR